MKLKYLGTAAAEGIPGLFCNCPVCQNALEKRGREIKTRSQAIVDGRLLIDFPQDTYMHVINYGLDLRSIKSCIITHNHSDHFHVREFWCRFEGIANGIAEEPLNVYLTEAGYREATSRYGDNSRVKFHLIRPFEPFVVEDYRVTPIEADHDAATDPVIYLIERDGKALLYANDTGLLPERSWEYLAALGKKIDFVSLDCTAMLLPGWRRSHMGLDTNREFHKRLCDMNLCDDSTVVYVNHFSHNGKATHEQLVKIAAEYGYGVTYDGLEIEI